MSRNAKRAVLAGAVLAIATIAGTAMAQTSTYEIKSGEVIAVKGNNLIVKGPEGVKEFWIADDFKFDRDSTFRSAQFSPQVFAENLAQPAIHEFIERRKIQFQPCGRHARRALIAIIGKRRERFAIA